MRALLRFFYRLLWKCFFVFPIDKDKIVLQSFAGRGFSDNPKYIAESLHKADPKLKLFWAVSDTGDSQFPEYIRKVKYRSVAYLFHMATAKCWVDNIRKPYSPKRKGQIYMQTWHAGFTLKKVERAAEAQLDGNYVREAKQDSKAVDVLLSNCDQLTEIYRNDFWYDGEILNCGLPRNDRLFHFTEEDAKSIRSKAGVPDGVRCLLYAPTFRKGNDLKPYDLNYAAVCDALERRFGGTWKILVRLHPNIFAESDNLVLDEKYVINASYYPDVQDLYIISDLLITDYSTVIFDFFLLDRPAFFYANDIASYMSDRGFYVQLKDLPFPLAENNGDLIKIINDFNRDEYDKKIKEFKEEQKFYDNGYAGDTAAKWISEHI